MENQTICSVCGIELEDWNYRTYNGYDYCESCFCEKFSFCDRCGDVVDREEISEVVVDYHWSFRRNAEHEYWCDDCVDAYAAHCDHCNDLVSTSEGHCDSNGIFICRNCTTDYTTCEECGCWIHIDNCYTDDEDYCYCRDCYINRTRGICDYSTKLDPIFHGDGPDFFGVELEIDRGGENRYNAERIVNIAGEDHIYAKHDGSLSDGFELVTHPCSYDYHVSQFPWKEILEEARALGYSSHDAGTCGLHVHISRNAFGRDHINQNENIGKFILLFEKFWNEVLVFSRRTPTQVERWAARYGLVSSPEEIMETAKGMWNRYKCVNITNSNTIEVRIFRGTLVYETLIASLTLCKTFYNIAMNYDTDYILFDLTWDEVLSIGAKINVSIVNYWDRINDRNIEYREIA